MRVTVLDNGLQSHFGHSYTTAKTLDEYLTALGTAHSHYAYGGAEPAICEELGCIPHFAHCLYDEIQPQRFEWLARASRTLFRGRPSDHSPSERATSEALNATYEADLERLPVEVWQQGNIVLIAGVMQHQLVGIARFLCQRADGRRATVVMQMHFLPDWLPWGKPSQFGADSYRRALDLLAPLVGRSVFFTAINEHVASYYRDHYGVDVRLLPFPQKGARAQKPLGARIRIGFFGYTKAEKGFGLLPEACLACRKARDDLDFTIQVQHHQTEPEVVSAEARLRAIPDVRILDGALEKDAFERESDAVDIMLLPYDPTVFGLRGSGIFIESVSAGRPVVASKGIWAARSIEAGEAVGEIFSPVSAPALAEAILRACANLSELKRQAADKALQFVQRNSIEAFGETLLSIGDPAR